MFKTEKIGKINQYLNEVIGLQSFTMVDHGSTDGKKLAFGDVSEINGKILSVAERFIS